LLEGRRATIMGNMSMKPKTFDCVRMKRLGAEQVMRQLEGKSLQEQLEYWQKGTEDLRRLR
jgi:hypothetical protein